ncbi:hypothetical protein K1719_042681 [Acacia pycnantha]|nr:hypothetical protein K1719_042681 [Acacia pycnantha]
MAIGKDVSKFVTENGDDKAMSLKLKKIGQMVEQCVGPGLVVNFGDLKCFVNEKASGKAVSYIVGELGKFLELNYCKFWLMGAAASCDCYLKFVEVNFQDYLPMMANNLGGDGLIDELCNGFNLLMDSDKGVITFDSLKRNSVSLGLQPTGFGE